MVAKITDLGAPPAMQLL